MERSSKQVSRRKILEGANQENRNGNSADAQGHQMRAVTASSNENPSPYTMKSARQTCKTDERPMRMNGGQRKGWRHPGTWVARAARQKSWSISWQRSRASGGQRLTIGMGAELRRKE